jgi:hypothetical protein
MVRLVLGGAVLAPAAFVSEHRGDLLMRDLSQPEGLAGVRVEQGEVERTPMLVEQGAHLEWVT